MKYCRWCIAGCALLVSVYFVPSIAAETAPVSRMATFRCDITPPPGQPLISCDPVVRVEEPLLAKGVLLEFGGCRYVLCALDWCELCNGSHQSMRQAIAEAAGAELAHVAVSCVHLHTAPLVDMDAQKLLADAGIAAKTQISPVVFEAIERRVAVAVRKATERLEPFDAVGAGQAKVDRVAATRRPKDAAGKILARYSACKDPAIRALPEGAIDPYLKTITLARGSKPLVRLHYYATHPQSRYGDGQVGHDFVGDAREELERREGVFQIYFTGCAGDVTVGKYNDEGPTRRKELAGRLLAGMEAAASATRLAPAGRMLWRTYPLRLPPRDDAGFNLADSLAKLKDSDAKTVLVLKMMSAVRAASIRRADRPIELSSLRIGDVHIVHLPGEPMACFQWFAQKTKPADFVAVAGYGDGGPGYLCPAKAFDEGGYEPTESNVKPESEVLLKKAIAALLGADIADY